MNQFELNEVTEVRLNSVSTRKEFHGEELVQAIDLSFEIEGGNEIMSRVDPALRQMFFYNRAAEVGQVALPGTSDVLPDLRAPKLQPKFSYGGKDKFKGYRFVLDYGLGDADSNVDLSDTAAGKHEFEITEGGSVKHRFQVSYAGEGLTDEALVRLVRLEREKVFIQLLAPSVLTLVKGGKSKPLATVADDESLFDEDEPEADATDTFIQTHGEAAAR